MVAHNGQNKNKETNKDNQLTVAENGQEKKKEANQNNGSIAAAESPSCFTTSWLLADIQELKKVEKRIVSVFVIDKCSQS